MIAPARIAAYDALAAVDAGRADLPHALARARANLEDERDRALAGEIATGTLRWQGAFDHVIQTFSGRPLARLDREVVVILRLTIFQLLHLDRVPASAAVNDAVSLTRKAGKKSAAPLVNAVLRRVSRERNRLPLPSPSDVLDYLSITLSHPRWLAARWVDRYGVEATEAWTRFNNGPAPLTLRANRLKTSPEQLADALASAGVGVRRGRFAPDALIVTNGNPLLTPLAGAGLFVVQDEASQLVALMAGARPGQVILDACGSPGGKTTAMAAAMGGSGLIVATDVRGKRVELLAATVRASGATNVRLVQADSARPLPFRSRFDTVLLDVPCSGLGTIRRDPDLKWRRVESDLAAMSADQLQMLHAVSSAVKPGGRLVYATCSSEVDENEAVVDAFVSNSHFRPSKPDHLPPEVAPLINSAGHLRTYPFRDGLEAFFAALLELPGLGIRGS
jgi:16S rRNA (cytosine967-C5)-methyltransferase